MDRRQFLLGGFAIVGGASLAGCGASARRLAASAKPRPAAVSVGFDSDLRILNRVAFGANSRDLVLLHRMGRAAYVDEQLSASQEDDWALQAQIRSLDIHHLSSAELADVGQEEVLRQLQQATLLRAVYSPNQLLERMVDFWTNHFNVYAHKGFAALRKPEQELAVIREYGLGRFPKLLREMAQSPALLAYLDNTSNQNGVPNENFARELMELHTLGVHGGYTQKDVREVARCFTGWTVEDRFLHPRGRFRFDPERHDPGRKTVLGSEVPAGGGQRDGDRVLELLARHPSTARHISTKLCRYFLGTAADALVAPTAQTYLRTGGDIAAMLRPILLSEELVAGPPIVKRPFDLVVSSLRRLEAETDAGKPVQKHLEALGEPLYQWPMPDGYPDKALAWTGSMLGRWNFASALCAAKIPGTNVDLGRLGAHSSDASDAMRLVLGRSPSPETPGIDAAFLQAGRSMSISDGLALCLMSAEFQWR